MGKDTEIQWCTHTFNPWRGCVKVSPGCTNCYAAAGAPRNPAVLGKWGGEGTGTRIVAAEAGWDAVRKWDCKAAKLGERHRVFCGSWMDICEDWQGPMLTSQKDVIRINESLGYWSTDREHKDCPVTHRDLTMDDVRLRLFGDVIGETTNLDWLLVTKRPERYKYVLPWMYEHAGQYRERYWENVWLGTTVENQEEADKRIPILLGTPAKVRFLSVEPLLGPVDLSKWLEPIKEGQEFFDHLSAIFANVLEEPVPTVPFRNDIHWVIVGGESGPNARPCDLAWIRSIVAQCKAAGVACFVKQLGSHVITRNDELGEWPEPFGHDESERYQGAPIRMRLRDSHGGDPSEWPEDLRVREIPEV